MVTLRIQELAEAKGITLEQLSQDSGVSVEKINKYAAESVKIEEETAADIHKIANSLNLSTLNLLQSAKESSLWVRIKIIDQLEKKNISLEYLSKKTGINLSVLVFYSTQPLRKAKISEPKIQDEIKIICNFLECSLDTLICDEFNDFLIRFDIDAFIEIKGLSEKDFVMLSNVSCDCIDLLRTQPIDNSKSSVQYSYSEAKKIWCETVGKHLNNVGC